MRTHALYPMLLEPTYQAYIWGGNEIAQRYNRSGTPQPCAESWEVSDLEGHESHIAQGAFEGMNLRALVETFGRDLIGTIAPDTGRFPLLIKVLDAHEKLSVQVHPDEVAAKLLGGESKHEMWYVLGATKEAQIYAGLKPDVTFERLEDIVPALQPYTMHVGDVIDIPGGTVHALGAGNLIYEVQQASNTTYRLYDWGRGRELHEQQGLASIHWEIHAAPLAHLQEEDSHGRVLRLATKDFQFSTLCLERDKAMHTTPKSCAVLFCESGKLTLDSSEGHPLTLLPGMSVLVPANQAFRLHPLQRSHLLMTQLG